APPRLLGHPAFAVRQPASSTTWSQGTGRYRVDPIALGNDDDRGPTYLVPVDSTTVPVIELRPGATPDPRDQLDAGIDLVITNSPDAIAYASTRPELVSHPLPWDRAYVLISSVPRPRAAAGDLTMLGDLLARDAVRADARGVRGPLWWRDVAPCRVAMPDEPVRSGSRTRPRVVYPRDDAVARDLATRLVAVGAFGSRTEPEASLVAAALPELSTAGGALTAVGLAPAELRRSVTDAADYAYIMPVPTTSEAPCAALQQLLKMAPLLLTYATRDSTGVRTATAFRLEQVMVPLVETRSTLIVRRGVADVQLEANGTIRLGRP
ncbi:MAG TPA: hypothetical protein VJ596_07495, partial [Gemmatimonadaceae bacterium]|nr:hypothetical protein [Gemmatimonadaceae bacterium]